MNASEEEREQDALEAAAEEKRLMDAAWIELVQSVLSHTRIDPKHEGKEFQPFLAYEGDVSSEQIAALKSSSYGNSLKRFVELWKGRATKDQSELSEVIELFKMLSVVTQSPYRQIKYLEKEKAPFSQLEILRKVAFLTTFPWADSEWQFDQDQLAEYLNTYIALGVEWPDCEKTILAMCINRTTHEQKLKVRSSTEIVLEKLGEKNQLLGVVSAIGMQVIGMLLPFLIFIGVNTWIVIWANKHLEGNTSSIWAIAGLVWVAITVPIAIVHYGTAEIRHSIRKIVEPGWDRYSPKANADLRAMHAAVNAYRAGHVNLRLVREQLTRLQNSDVKMPVQLITLIDRAIAKGLHSW